MNADVHEKITKQSAFIIQEVCVYLRMQVLQIVVPPAHMEKQP